MARFPYHQRNVRDLGRVLAKAALDENFRKSLQRDPASLLLEIGLPKQTIELMKFKVIDQKQCTNAVALPFRLNEKSLANANVQYLESLSKSFDLN